LNTNEDDVTLDKRNYILDIPHGNRKWKCMKDSGTQCAESRNGTEGWMDGARIRKNSVF
jgi:hypothetical protein